MSGSTMPEMSIRPEPWTVGNTTDMMMVKIRAYIEGTISIQVLMTDEDGILEPFKECMQKSHMENHVFLQYVVRVVINRIIGDSWNHDSTAEPKPGMLRNANGRAAEIVIYLTSDAFSSNMKHPTIRPAEVGTTISLESLQLNPRNAIEKYRNFHEFALVLFRERRPGDDEALTAEGRCFSGIQLALGALGHLLNGTGAIEVVYPIVRKWFTRREDDISGLLDLSRISWEDCCMKVTLQIDELSNSDDEVEQSLADEAFHAIDMFEQETLFKNFGISEAD
ncbi:hypothetical protein AB5N19_06655 [Seiridium cardinale]|uniref:Uncharacterized protein n=1 Tax=Seiridium cardinale TaxID=138064 RepID=A0ABR2XKY3_9PEZI